MTPTITTIASLAIVALAALGPGVLALIAVKYLPPGHKAYGSQNMGQ